MIAGHSVSLALLFSVSFGALDAIRTLKDGPMIDAEGREYKSSAVRTDAKNISGPRSNARSPVQVHCTETSMIILVKADLYKNGRTLSPGELYLGKVEHSASSQCRAVPASDTEYVIEAGLQDCGSKLTVSGCYCQFHHDEFIFGLFSLLFFTLFLFLSRYLRTTLSTQTS